MATPKKSAIPPKELAIFCRQMSLIIGSDITVMQGVEMLHAQADDSRLQAALRAVLDKMEQSVLFSEAFAEQTGMFPEYLTSMVTVGEQSGTLDIVFAQMADYYEKEHRVQRKVSSALTYPAILTALMLGVIALLVLRILPMFEDILINMGGTMPAITQALMSTSNFLVDNILWVVIAIVVVICLYMVYRSTPFGKRLSAKNKLFNPFAGSVRRRVLTARFARSVGILLRSGVPILTALEAMDALLGNQYAGGKLKEARLKVQEGGSLTDALAETGLFPTLFIRLATVGQTTGYLDQMMLKAAAIYDDEVDDALEKLTTAIEPVLIIILSVIVGVILLSVMLPMISIMAKVG